MDTDVKAHGIWIQIHPSPPINSIDQSKSEPMTSGIHVTFWEGDTISQ